MKMLVKKGATSVIVAIFIQDSSSTTGAGLTGLTNATSGLVAYRARSDDGNAGGTAISLASATRGTWTSAGFVEKDATNMPGVYELGIPNAALATGSNYCVIMLKGAANMAPVALEIQLVDWDPQAANLPVDIKAINGDSTGAANLAKTTRAIARGTVGSSASTTSIPTSAFTPAGAATDQFKGRIVTFDADTATAALQGQSTDITASSNAATPTLTVSALSTAPASGDTFSVT